MELSVTPVRMFKQKYPSIYGNGRLIFGPEYTHGLRGPLQGKMIFVVIDAHSKWVETITVPAATSSNTSSVDKNVCYTWNF